MENRTNKTRVITSVMLTAFIFLSIFFFAGKISVKKQLKDEKIKFEASLSDKLQLNKTIDRIKADLISLTKKNDDLNKSIVETNGKLREKEAIIKRMTAENASVKKLKKQIDELEALKNKLDKDLSEIRLVADNLRSENAKLNELLATVQKDNEALAFNNSILKAMTADNYRIEALKGKNEKLTVNAKRTNKLFVTMDIPSSSEHGLYFKVVTPDGTEYSSKTDLSANIKIIDTPEGLLASNDDENGALVSGKKRIEMSYKPNEKLKKGVYQFNIYNEKTYIGSTQLRLK